MEDGDVAVNRFLPPAGAPGGRKVPRRFAPCPGTHPFRDPTRTIAANTPDAPNNRNRPAGFFPPGQAVETRD